MHSSAKVFLLSGDAFYARFYSIFLHHMGYENTSSFYNSLECLNKLKDKPDVIFLDAAKEKKTNDNLIESIRLVNRNVPIVMLADENLAKPEGVVVLPKTGITPELMGETVETLLSCSN